MKIFWASMALLISACATTTGRLFPIEHITTDHPEAEQLEIAFSNDRDEPICLPDGVWPTRSGSINQASEYVALIVDGNRYPIADVNTGYCVGVCHLKVMPGETIHAFIPYRQFSLPNDLYVNEKRLIFSAVGYICSN